MTSVSTKSDPLAHDPLQRDAHRVGGVCARSDLGQLGERLVVVSVDKGQLHPGGVAQLGRESHRDVQPGVGWPPQSGSAASPLLGAWRFLRLRQMIK
jgi:hypothetical protein